MSLTAKIIDEYLSSFSLPAPIYLNQRQKSRSPHGKIQLPYISHHEPELDNKKNIHCLIVNIDPTKKAIKNNLFDIIESNLSDPGDLILICPTERIALRVFYKYTNLNSNFFIQALINIEDGDKYCSVIFLSKNFKKNAFVHEFIGENIDKEISLLKNTLEDFKTTNDAHSNDFKDNLIGDYIFIDEDFQFIRHKGLKEVESLEGFFKDSVRYVLKEVAEDILWCAKKESKINEEIIAEWKKTFDGNKKKFIVLDKNSLKLATTRFPSKDNPLDQKFVKNKFLIIVKNNFDPIVIQNFLNSEIGMAIKKAFSSQRKTVENGKMVKGAILGIKNLYKLPILILSPRETYKFSSQGAIEKVKKFLDEIKLNDLENKIEESDKKKLQDLLNIIGMQTKEELAEKRLSEDEGTKLELKSGFSMNDQYKKSDELPMKIFQTICAFLNTEGGFLYCGIRDSGELLGIDDEIKYLYKSNVDSFLLNFYQKLENYIGKSKTIYVSAEILSISSKLIFEIEVRPCFDGYGSYFDKDETVLIRRTGPRNQKLKGRDIVKYLSNRNNSIQE